MGQRCSVSTHEDMQLWMLLPTAYSIAAEPGAFSCSLVWSRILCYHHSNAPCLVST